jgi:hypothetical protein
MNPHTSKWVPTLGVEVSIEFRIFRWWLYGSTLIGKTLETWMFKMGSHDPFGYLKHKLWPKKGRKSNCQFDSWPLKVKNRFILLVCRWHATYHWKIFNEDYNFDLDLTSIGGLNKKLWATKVARVPISRLPTWESRDKMTFGCKAHNQTQIILMKKVVASPKFGLWWILWVCVCAWFVRSPKVLQL